MQMFSFTSEDLEDNADVVKVVVLEGLVRDGLIAKDVAEEWAEKTTILHRKKTIFHTLTDKWLKAKVEPNKYYYLVVSKK